MRSPRVASPRVASPRAASPRPALAPPATPTARTSLAARTDDLAAFGFVSAARDRVFRQSDRRLGFDNLGHAESEAAAAAPPPGLTAPLGGDEFNPFHVRAARR